jgi:hypothetical protein
MAFLSSVLLIGASVLSVSGQTTTAPPASTPTLGNSPLPLTQYSFKYPNLVRGRFFFPRVVLMLPSFSAGASQPFPCWTWTSIWLQYLQLDHGTSWSTTEHVIVGADFVFVLGRPQVIMSNDVPQFNWRSVLFPSSQFDKSTYYFVRRQISVYGVLRNLMVSLETSKLRL